MRLLLEYMRRTSAAQAIGPIGTAVIVGSAVSLHATGVSRVLEIPGTLVRLGGIVILVIWLTRVLFNR